MPFNTNKRTYDEDVTRLHSSSLSDLLDKDWATRNDFTFKPTFKGNNKVEFKSNLQFRRGEKDFEVKHKDTLSLFTKFQGIYLKQVFGKSLEHHLDLSSRQHSFDWRGQQRKLLLRNYIFGTSSRDFLNNTFGFGTLVFLDDFSKKQLQVEFNPSKGPSSAVINLKHQWEYNNFLLSSAH